MDKDEDAVAPGIVLILTYDSAVRKKRENTDAECRKTSRLDVIS